MRITIISDIKGNAESIIPYGLNLAKHLKGEVNLVHVIDSRMAQGVSSMYADSQSITPGNKFSHAEIMAREKQQVAMKIDQVLSKEASKLNYPLKVNVDIQEDSIENKITNDLNESTTSLLVFNKEADGAIFESQKEIIDCCKDFNGMSLLVPPGEEFQPFSSAVLPTDFSDGEFEDYRNVADLIRFFHPVVNAVGMANETGDEVLQQWEANLSKVFNNSSVNHQVITAGDFEKEVIDFINLLDPDLTMIFERPRNLITSIFKKEFLKKILEQTRTPVLFCSGKK
ncbi:hypothetical protein [uncultured Sunxiuqinia sp.]|mgnify:CR=1 FL=1|jgi:hypothetical protein|uniref:hypothetical protein n=1 Tax=uncultured Sunxiuqinia sp. TaxID=1573825 RepID=UPI0030D7D7A4|tara:strand:- start:18427 stop:19281 length:855 start_codon:yes stop_codon:yes gene_type:complete